MSGDTLCQGTRCPRAEGAEQGAREAQERAQTVLEEKVERGWRRRVAERWGKVFR